MRPLLIARAALEICILILFVLLAYLAFWGVSQCLAKPIA